MAVGLLRPCEKFNLDDFKIAWQGSVPEGSVWNFNTISVNKLNCVSVFLGMTTNLKQLDGIVLVDHYGHPQTIRYFNEQDLPDNIMDRMQYLFQIREKWTFNEIRPFVE